MYSGFRGPVFELGYGLSLEQFSVANGDSLSRGLDAGIVGHPSTQDEVPGRERLWDATRTLAQIVCVNDKFQGIYLLRQEEFRIDDTFLGLFGL